LVWLCGWGCSSFDFAEALASYLSFSVRLLLVVSSFRVSANVRGLPQGWYFIAVRLATEAD